MLFYNKKIHIFGNFNMKMVKNMMFLFLTLLIPLNDAHRILGIFPLEARSHNMVFNAIVKVLARRGHQVDVMTHIPLEKPVPNYKVVVNLQNEAANLTNAWDIKTALEFDIDMSTVIPTIYGNELCKYLKHPDLQKIIKNPPKDPPYDLVLMEGVGCPCYMGVGWALKVPVIMASTAIDLPWLIDLLGQPTNTAYYPQFSTNYIHPMSFTERLYNTLSTYSDIYTFRRLTNDVQNDLVKKYIDSNIPPLQDLEKDVVLALVNSHYTLHGIRPLVPGLIEIGGIHVHEHYQPMPYELEKWMNESTAGVIYFTLGSIVNIETFSDDIMRAFYSVFESLAPMRVLMKVANKDKLLPGLPKNVKISSWIPQVAILKHKNIKVFITHGGLMSTQEALTFGVPMLGIPLFADQFRNINIFVRKNIALKLDYQHLTKNSIYNALKEILNNPKYKNGMEHERLLFLDRPITAENATIFWTEYAIRNGPGTLRSPSVNMPWWQVALLDVYMLIFLTVTIGIYLIFIILRTVFNMIFCKEQIKSKTHKD